MDRPAKASISWLLVILFLLALLLPGCAGSADPVSEGLAVGSMAPAFTLPEHSGSASVNYPEEFKGKKTLLFFLAFG